MRPCALAERPGGPRASRSSLMETKPIPGVPRVAVPDTGAYVNECDCEDRGSAICTTGFVYTLKLLCHDGIVAVVMKAALSDYPAKSAIERF